MKNESPRAFLSLFIEKFRVSDVAKADLNSSEAALAHRQQLQSKKFLHRLYDELYAVFCRHADELKTLRGDILELGSGAGFLKERLPQIVTSDVVPLPFVDRVIFADKLPYADGTLKGIFAMNVLHHLADPEAFFKEAERCLAHGGRIVLIDEHSSWWGRFVYTYLHYEPFNMDATEWKLPDSGRLETANGAMAHIIFDRDRTLFDRRFPRLRVGERAYHTVFCYLLSGGVSWPALVPAFSYPLFMTLDRLLARAHRIFPVFQTIVIEKT